MKIKHLILLCLLLVVLTLAAADATENADAISDENITEVDVPDFDESASQIDMEVTDVPENVTYAKYVSCNVEISNQDAAGTLYVYIDEMPEYSYGYSVSGPINATFQSSNYVNDFGNHTLFVRYADNTGIYADKTLNFTFTVDDYELSISSNYGDVLYGENYSIGFSLPFDAKGTLIVTHNGVEYEIPSEAYYWLITIPSQNLLLGRNEVKLHFIPSNGCKLPEKTVTDSFNCYSKIRGFTSPVQVYGEVEDVILMLPKDACDHLVIKSDDHTFFRASRMANGMASVSLKDLRCGKYLLEASYMGGDYEVEKVILDFEIVPKVSVPYFTYNGNATFPVEVKLSSKTPATLTVRSTFKNEEIILDSPEGVVIVNLKTPDRDARVTVNYTQDDLTFQEEYWVTARSTAPEFEMNVTVGDVLKGRNLYADIDIPQGYGLYADEAFDGYFVLYIDDVEAAKSQNTWIFYNTKSLDLGSHEWRVEFQNDWYYFAEAKSGTFNVEYFSCEFEENITSAQSSVVVNLAGDATGMLTLSVDGEECDSKIITDYVMLLKLPDDLTIAKHDIEVRYTGNYPDASKKGTINVDYPFEVKADDFGYAYVYGQPVTLTVKAPKELTGNVVIYIGDKNYTIGLLNGTAKMTLDDLGCGSYTVTACYNGDSSFPPKTANCTFAVEGYAVLGPQQNYINYGGAESLRLALPGGEGNLTVEVDDEIYKSVRLQDGKACISLEKLIPGVHKLHAYYSGADYTVTPYDRDIFHVEVGVIYSANVNVNEDAWIYMKIPDDAQSCVIMNLTGEIRELIHNGGVINETFTLSKFGDYEFTLQYNGTDYAINLSGGTLHVKPASFTCPLTITDEDNAVSFTLPSDAKGNVSVYGDVSGKYSSLIFKKNVSGPAVSLSLSGLKPGRYNLKILYEDETYGNYSFEGIYLTVPNPVPEISVSNSGNDKKTIFTFTLPDDATGDLIVKIDGTSHYCKIAEGKANLTLNNLLSGRHTLFVRYSGCDNYSAILIERNISVESSVPARIVAGDASSIYSSKSKYTVTVYGKGGTLAVNAEVIFKINGRKVAAVKTDSKGIAGYNIVQKPGTYMITAEALGISVTKKLTVKHVLKLQKVKIKRSAKRIVIKATLLKVNGKYLKGKKITLKFNGKKYVARTDRKGVAKFTIKNKKLKAGKKVTYQATYLKDTVKYSVKVKR